MSPDLLFRVFDDQSIVGFDNINGFTAAALTAFRPYEDPVSAKADVERHARWANNTPTPIISTISSYQLAARFARGRSLQQHGNMHVAIIDRSKLEGVVDIYQMLDLVETLGAHIRICYHSAQRVRYEEACSCVEGLKLRETEDTRWRHTRRLRVHTIVSFAQLSRMCLATRSVYIFYYSLLYDSRLAVCYSFSHFPFSIIRRSKFRFASDYFI